MIHSYRSILLLLVLMLILILAYFTTRKSPLGDVENYRIYYHSISPEIFKMMESKDLIILEALHIDELQSTKILDNTKSKFIGYISVFEIGGWDEDILSQVSEEMLLDHPQIFKDRIIGDIRNSDYQRILLKTIDRRIFNKNLDGVFLDTVEFSESKGLSTSEKESLQNSYHAFLKVLRKRHPHAIIIQNRGFSSFDSFAYKYVDALLWENFKYSQLDVDNLNQIKRWNRLKKIYKFDVLTLSYDEVVQNQTLSESFGWIHWQVDLQKRYSEWQD